VHSIILFVKQSRLARRSRWRRNPEHPPAGLEADVTIQDVGEGTAELGESIDTAYGAKYGSAGSASMVTASAAATPLRLTPSQKRSPNDNTP
jgi:hypothetical protein